MTSAEEILAGARTVLVVDWPSVDVPEALARAGFEVVVHGGPRPDDYTAYEVQDDRVVTRHVGRPPDQADLVYTYRPLDELPEIVDMARALGARAVWVQSDLTHAGGSSRARAVVENSGIVYVDKPYIVDAVRSGPTSGRRS